MWIEMDMKYVMCKRIIRLVFVLAVLFCLIMMPEIAYANEGETGDDIYVNGDIEQDAQKDDVTTQDETILPQEVEGSEKDVTPEVDHETEKVTPEAETDADNKKSEVEPEDNNVTPIEPEISDVLLKEEPKEGDAVIEDNQGLLAVPRDVTKEVNNLRIEKRNGELYLVGGNISNDEGTVWIWTDEETGKRYIVDSSESINSDERRIRVGFTDLGETKYYSHPETGEIGDDLKNIKEDGEVWYFVRNGEVDKSFTGLAKNLERNTYYYVKDGVVDLGYTGLAKSIFDGTYYYAENGAVTYTWRGLAKNPEDKIYYYVDRSHVTENFTGLAKSEYDGHYYFARNGKVDYTFTGLAKSVADGNYYFARNGWVDYSFRGLAKSIADGHYYYANRLVDYKFTGLAKSVADGCYYFARNSRVDYGFRGLAKSDYDGRYYYANRLVDYKFTGLAKSVADGNYYFARNSMVDYSFKGLAKSDYDGNYYYANRIVDYTYTGPSRSVASIQVFHVKNGMWAKNYTGHVKLSNNEYDVQNGVVVSSTIMLDGNKVDINSKGLQQGWAKAYDKKFYVDGNGNIVKGHATINGKLYYFNSNGELSSLVGIDVSDWQGDIDWNKVKADGIDFAFIRVGGRGWTSEKIYDDSNALRNIEGATKAGLKVGVYFFTQAVNTQEALEEAQFTLDMIKGYNISFPVVIDTENSGYDKRHTLISKEERTAVVKTFLDYVSSKGYTAMYYAGWDWSDNNLDVSQLDDKYEHWVAHYASTCGYTGPYRCWQYSEGGSVNGVAGNVDMNIWYESK